MRHSGAMKVGGSHVTAGVAVVAVAIVTWALALAVTDAPRDRPRFSQGDPLPEGVSLAGGEPAPPAEGGEPLPDVGAAAPPPGEASDTPPRRPFRPTDTARRPALAAGPFFVTTIDSANTTASIARYVDGLPAPAGAVVAPREGAAGMCLTSPSVTRDAAGTFFLYALERRCNEPLGRRVAVFTSRDGKQFSRRGTAVDGREFSSAYFVHDEGVIRGWYGRTERSRPGLYYAESRDGLRFDEIGGPRYLPRQLNAVVRDGSRWYALMTIGPDGRPDRPFLMTLAGPRARFRGDGYIGKARGDTARVAVPARAGDRALVTAGRHGVRAGDLIVLRRASSGTVEGPVQVAGVDGRTLRLRDPLKASYRPADELALVARRRLAPSYVCRAADGTWRGIFTSDQAFEGFNREVTVAYRADSLRGPWTADRSAPAPLLTLENQEVRRSVGDPTPVTESPDVQRCP